MEKKYTMKKETKKECKPEKGQIGVKDIKIGRKTIHAKVYEYKDPHNKKEVQRKVKDKTVVVYDSEDNPMCKIYVVNKPEGNIYVDKIEKVIKQHNVGESIIYLSNNVRLTNVYPVDVDVAPATLKLLGPKCKAVELFDLTTHESVIL